MDRDVIGEPRLVEIGVSCGRRIFKVSSAISVRVAPGNVAYAFPFARPAKECSFVVEDINYVFVYYVGPIRLVDGAKARALSFHGSACFGVFSRFQIGGSSTTNAVLVYTVVKWLTSDYSPGQGVNVCVPARVVNLCKGHVGNCFRPFHIRKTRVKLS